MLTDAAVGMGAACDRLAPAPLGEASPSLSARSRRTGAGTRSAYLSLFLVSCAGANLETLMPKKGKTGGTCYLE